jgi:mono/diheme cytochrome c family protein
MKSLRWLTVGLGLVAALIVLAVVYVYFASEARLSVVYQVPEQALAIPADQLSLERGRYLATALVGCRDCHGRDFGGAPFITDPAIGMLYGPNLTRGAGGIGADYSDADWVRAIRHGVARNGKGLLGIPAGEYMNFSEADLAAVTAYLKTLPPVDRQMPKSQVGPLGRALLVAGAFPPPAAELIDHNRQLPAAIAPAPTADYGQYLASLGCIGCHRADLTGGVIPGVPPEWPPAPDLTRNGALGSWSEGDFMLAMRAGMAPGGRPLNPDYMPWPVFTNMTDDDLRALWLYLQSIDGMQSATTAQTMSE